MLYLRNTNQIQSVGSDIKRGITNVCCTPTLNSVTTASLTELTVNSTFGTYLVNCKSCVGGYIQVSENSGSSWTTINPGNCSTTNLVPQPSQSAYYRLFTSCSANDQPFDPLVSDYSNEILFIPNGYINYKFIEQSGANGLFKIYSNADLEINATASVSGTLWEIPSASFATASIVALDVPLTGSTSMSLSITGSNVSFSTASCAQSGTIFLDDWKVIPHLFYDVTASINFRPENTCTASTYTDLGYTVNSYDEASGRWYHANQYGVPDTSSTYPYATLVGASTATRTNVASGDCRYNAIQFSGSMILDLDTDTYSQLYIAITTGSFTLSGIDGNNPLYTWSSDVRYEATGSINAFGYQIDNATTKNSLVGLAIGQYFPSAQEQAIDVFVSGSNVATNPPTWQYGPHNFGTTLTITGQGVLRGFGLVQGDTALQSQYNCIYDTTPSN